MSGYSNHLVKQIGEFLVCAELGREGLVATAFAGSVPGYDVVATNEKRKSVLIQVKTAQAGKKTSDASYCWNLTGRFLDIAIDPKTKRQSTTLKDLPLDRDLVHVLVLLRGSSEQQDRFFVCRGFDLRDACFRVYTEYLARHNHVRPRNPQSKDNRIRPGDLRAFENRWELIHSVLDGRVACHPAKQQRRP